MNLSIAMKSKLIPYLATFLLTAFFLTIYATPYMAVATLAYGAIICGFVARKDRITHIRLMSTGILIDLSLVLTLEFQRDAIGKAIGGTLNTWQLSHIVASTFAVLCYLPAGYLGWKMASGRKTAAIQKSHKICGFSALIFRTIGFILMFSFLHASK